MPIRLGYACDNVDLGFSASHTCRLKTFEEKGIEYVQELITQNLDELIRILEWNSDNGISFFRISSNLFPMMFKYEIKQLPKYEYFKSVMRRIGDECMRTGFRINFHPEQYCVLGSVNQTVVDNSIKELNQHGEIMDMFGFDRSPYYNVNIHMSTAQGGKDEAIKRFISAYERLDESIKKRLTVENDDKANQYSVKELMAIYETVGVPIVFDYHHHRFCDGGLTEEEALKLASTTWGNVKQETHYSESKSNEVPYVQIKKKDGSIYEKKTRPQAHSDYIKNVINDYGLDIDVMIEAKKKNRTLLEYRKMINEYEKDNTI